MKWISIKDRLPDEDIYILVITAYNNMEVCIRNDSQWWYCSREYAYHISDITHWMLLPDKPK